MNKHQLLFVALLLAVTALLSACGSGESNVSSGNREKILHWGNGTEPQELDPHIVTGVPEHHIIVALLEGLVLKDSTTLEPRPGVAERWEISDDGKVYTFYLRSDARWSNGDSVTAEDFRWSWQRALSPALGNVYAYMYFPIVNAEAFATGKIDDFSQVGVKVLDSHTLQVSLNNPTPYFLQLLDHYSMFPVHRPTIERFGAADERGTLWTRAGNFVGNGAFTLKQWELNRVVIVERNPYYWGADKVKLNQIHFYPTDNTSTEERMFRAGQLHVTGTVPVDKIQLYREKHPELIHIDSYLGTYYYRINTRVKHLQDPRVRRALALSIDREQIVRHVTKAGEIPATTFTPPDTMGYTAHSDLGFDPQRARQLMAAAGHPDGKDFPTLELLYNTSEGHRKIAVAIQQMWKKNLNIDIQLHNQDWKVYLDSVNSGNYQIARAGWIGDYVDPNSFLDMWITDGGNNQTGWSNARYDELILQTAPQAKDRNARYQAFLEAESILLDELPLIPIYTYVSKKLVQPSVRGLHGNLLDYHNYKAIDLVETPSVEPLKP